MKATVSLTPRRAQEQALVDSNLDLVWRVAKGVARAFWPILQAEDLVGDGAIGLLQAAAAFDPTRGCSFRTFAVSRIRGAIYDGLRAFSWAPRIERGRAKARGAEVHSQLQADDLFWEQQACRAAPAVDPVEAQDELLALFRRLSARERLVVCLYQVQGLNLKEVAEVLGVSESRVSQVLARAMEKLRRAARRRSCQGLS